MTEPSNLRDAAEVWRDAYWTWANDPSFGSTARSVAIIEADRAAVEAATIAKVVTWLRQPIAGGDNLEPVCDTHTDIASAIEAGEWKQ